MKKIVLLLSTVILMTACSPVVHGMGDMNMRENGLIDVKLSWDQEVINANEAVTFQAVVSQAGKGVNDANKVVFEIWKNDKPLEKHEKIEVDVNSAVNGHYNLQKTFTEVGQYHVIAHVTARGSHSMPEKTFDVGAKLNGD